jgi:flagella basal body P-ring formation protein FlgA
MTIRTLLVLTFCAIAFSAFADANPNQVDVAVPAHDISRGAVLTESDLSYTSISALRANDSIVKAIADAAGMEARRALRAGEFIRTSDLKRPTVVAKGSNVTMTFEADGLLLTAVGRAMADGGEGEVISILNPTSFRQVQAMVVAPGKVRVGDALDTSHQIGQRAAAK